MWQITYFYPPHSEFKWLWFLACFFFFFLMLEGFQGCQTGKQLTWIVFNKENKRIPRNGRSWSIVWHVFLLFVFCSLIFGNKLCRNLNRSLSSYQNSYLVPRLRRIKEYSEEFFIAKFQYHFCCFIPLSLASKNEF